MRFYAAAFLHDVDAPRSGSPWRFTAITAELPRIVSGYVISVDIFSNGHQGLSVINSISPAAQRIKMRHYLAGLLFLLAVFVQTQQSTPTGTPGSATPKDAASALQPGAYYWNGSEWTPMEQINMSGGGLKHVGKMFVPGLTPQYVYTYRDARAPIQVKEAVPQFCYKFVPLPPGTPYAPSGRDVVIVRFDEKKDHRELQTTSGGNVFTFKSGMSKDRMPDLGVTMLDQGTFIITTKSPLSPGEYLFSGSTVGFSGYDFGFHPPK
jgi:hypothetical protein